MLKQNCTLKSLNRLIEAESDQLEYSRSRTLLTSRKETQVYRSGFPDVVRFKNNNHAAQSSFVGTPADRTRACDVY